MKRETVTPIRELKEFWLDMRDYWLEQYDLRPEEISCMALATFYQLLYVSGARAV